ncbi:hypothetical protein [Haloflavibacter putidus]|uniref:Uncharacterized protein n=1 Tax=Haloflavibacter putidus TaxID=2576776 RepID=A0A507Z9I4_9FLAO|nr:hypothetical protein [Haloflavibacter putidus]TQD34376.1 hypothetical protein FKR84_12105 [Haloflavibacter putidus]
MKKIITLFTFVFASLVFANAGFAQNTSEKEIMQETRDQVSDLGVQLELTTEQKDLMVRYFYAYNLNYDRNLAGAEKNKTYFQKKQKFEGELIRNTKKVLNPAQFEKFKDLNKSGEGVERKE